MKKIILSAVAIFGMVAANNVNAQHFSEAKIGIKGGVNVANITNAQEQLDDKKALTTFNAGVVAVLPLSQTFEIRTGLDLQSKGLRSKESGGIARYNPMYLELPVNLAFQLPINERVKAYVGAGPYAAVGLLGKYQTANTSYDAKNIKWGNDVPGNSGDPKGEGYMKRFDAGANIIAGLDFGKVGLHAQYGLGLANTVPSNSSYFGENKKFQHRVLGVSGIFYF